eukprot:UN01092
MYLLLLLIVHVGLFNDVLVQHPLQLLLQHALHLYSLKQQDGLHHKYNRQRKHRNA